MTDETASETFSHFDLDASTEQAWTGFAERLAEVLSVMDAGATLRIGALATEAEADLVLDKPFELVDLERHVAELLAGRLGKR